MELKVEFMTTGISFTRNLIRLHLCAHVCTYLYLCACEVRREENTRKLSRKPTSCSLDSLMSEAVDLSMMKAPDGPRELCLISGVVFLMCMLGDFSWEDSVSKN